VVVPADNSCLFRAVAFLMEPGVIADRVTDPNAIPEGLLHHLRQQVANHVLSHPEEFNEAVLERPPLAYCEWIQKPESWGGGLWAWAFGSFGSMKGL
jgi:ubiquitin thioesterase OTU1